MPNGHCVFCDAERVRGQIIWEGELAFSLISRPRFRPGHCLVIPRRHVTTLAELTEPEGAAIMLELGRLSALLDTGYGSGVMQKYQPRQGENGIKVHHLHLHVFPREEEERGLFPVPQPNGFEGFSHATDEEDQRLLAQLR
jgi:histidine triad (HIT) family protein